MANAQPGSACVADAGLIGCPNRSANDVVMLRNGALGLDLPRRICGTVDWRGRPVGHASRMVRPNPFTHSDLAGFVAAVERLVADLQGPRTGWLEVLHALDALLPDMSAIASSDTVDVEANAAFRSAFERHHRHVDEVLEPAVIHRSASPTVRRALTETLGPIREAALGLAADARFGSVVMLDVG